MTFETTYSSSSCRDNQKQIDDALAPLKTQLSQLMDKAKTSVGGAAAAKKEE